MKILISTLLIIIAGCASSEKDLVIEKIEALDNKSSTYKPLVTQSEHGWVSPEDCDAMIFNGLLAATGFFKIDIMAARRGDFVQRTPIKECLEAGTISRDMLVGWLHWIWTAKDFDSLDKFISSAEKSKWIVGDYPSDADTDVKNRVKVSNNLQAIMYEMRNRMGGPFHIKQKTPKYYDSFARGYEVHIQVMSIHLLGRMRGKIKKHRHDLIKAHRDRNKGNALLQALASRYGDGDMKNAVDILLDETLFPNDRLPDHRNYCTDYLWQREQSKIRLTKKIGERQVKEGVVLTITKSEIVPNDDWYPCEEKKKHFKGIDWLVAYAVVTGKL